MDTTVIIVVGVFFLAMGGYALAAPAALARPFRMKIDSPEGRSEIRAVYGGFGLAVAGVLGAAAADFGGIRTGVVIAVGAALAGMALGRLISRAVDTRTAFYPIWFYFCVEVAAAGLLFTVA
ncbi:DUF4345 domain-containing protein [Allokutzneria sp. A3M-2-11 16]|uniref:DUF4345 domain-containing protein n=1 Tax=Allokutzneria sp. A3M-2-11 16 TaxID=2962043 RepID=UPI0020B63F92|nr:DUF4345 domain-containing protein [Allokutzneria sp. A3M-2-11 16]MCP3803118.1 DUF4345 domain-containing protein [Allokutzneria sp. A3M-2-11 16]